jgi:hydrogenase-4 component F
MELLLLLGVPACGAVLLGLFGGRARAPEFNVVFSLGTFLAACALTARVIATGNLLLGREQFFIDSFNVFLVALTAFIGLTTSLFSRPTCASRCSMAASRRVGYACITPCISFSR